MNTGTMGRSLKQDTPLSAPNALGQHQQKPSDMLEKSLGDLKLNENENFRKQAKVILTDMLQQRVQGNTIKKMSNSNETLNRQLDDNHPMKRILNICDNPNNPNLPLPPPKISFTAHIAPSEGPPSPPLPPPPEFDSDIDDDVLPELPKTAPPKFIASQEWNISNVSDEITVPLNISSTEIPTYSVDMPYIPPPMPLVPPPVPLVGPPEDTEVEGAEEIQLRNNSNSHANMKPEVTTHATDRRSYIEKNNNNYKNNNNNNINDNNINKDEKISDRTDGNVIADSLDSEEKHIICNVCDKKIEE